ncbi:6-phosphogluconolactonase [Variovorax sp. PBS-H4]|uniref:lactonase family protein n=1 Tax=Variovorax sp. PBS-H4 TaxID=434008 RepID=UPI0013194A7D|nr:lactonase family protein [Variovorax sp. PBS-H4]VTU38745.1 6-phosphogluconolactonase [Variovorax sp. PBS-H4]
MTAAVYVSNAESGDITVFSLDERTGTLTRRQDVAVGGTLMPMALSPDRRRLYVARRSAPLAVIGFSIDPASGRLAPLGEAPLAHSMAYIATDRSGRHLFSASYGGHLVAVNPIDADGKPQAARQIIPTGSNAHCVQADAANRHVYATCLGSGVVMHWHFDAASGTLAPAEPAAWEAPPGSGPRHFVFAPGGRFIYLLGELDGSITVLGVDAASGALTALQSLAMLPPGFTGEPWAADLHLTPDGRFLYACERRSSTLAIIAVDALDGRLAAPRYVPTEAQPRGFAIDARGLFLVAAGQLSHRVTLYAIDPDSGALAVRDTAAAGRDPNWVEIVALSE